MRLNPRLRWALYAVFALMVTTGVAWLIAAWQKGASGEDYWQTSAAWLLMVHGGGAMVTLLLLGALLPLHSLRAWRSHRNRAGGVVMITLNALLIVTSFGLYYLGSEAIRLWMSNIHIAAGLMLPIALVVHIALGRRSAGLAATSMGNPPR